MCASRRAETILCQRFRASSRCPGPVDRGPDRRYDGGVSPVNQSLCCLTSVLSLSRHLTGLLAVASAVSGCGLYCSGPANLSVEVVGEVADRVILVTERGDEVELVGEDYGSEDAPYWSYTYTGKPGVVEILVEACGGTQQVVERAEATPSSRCQDKEEVTYVDVVLDPC